MTTWLLAFDFGGTKHTAGLIAQGVPEWEAHKRAFSPPAADAQYDIETMIGMGRELLGGRKAAAIGVSFGGPVDAARGVALLSHHVPGWEDTPLATRLADAFAAPVQVDNDANVAALGEHRFGAGRGYDSLLYITVSTGVGGGWVLDGRIWHGANSMAGEIGHTVVDPQGPRCLCHKRGCVERLASGPYMAQDARQRLQQNRDQGAILRAMVDNDLDRITGEVLSQAAAAGDEVATEILQRGASALGTGIGNAANLLNPERIILGGGVTKSGAAWWQTVRAVARKTALPQLSLEIVAAQLGDDAPLWGAVALAENLLK